MEQKGISRLAAALRENGHQVLNGHSKLTLPVALLQALNSNFSMTILNQTEDFGSTFQVINNSNSRIEILRDLQFLHDFVQKTVGLKLTAALALNGHEEPVDIRKFRCLKLLELHRVHVKAVQGIKGLQSQLQFLVCSQSLNHLEEVLVECGADEAELYVWSELKEAVFSFNNLTEISHILELTPWLYRLDLSHNCLTNIEALNCLQNLKYLNLSYNQLSSLPKFNRNICAKLQVLNLKNNHLETVAALASLENVQDLDLSENCLMDHNALSDVLPSLAALQILSLEGNPLSYHPKHRTSTCIFLNSNTASFKFLLDCSPLSKSERLHIGMFNQMLRTNRNPREARDRVVSTSSMISNVTSVSNVTAIEVTDLTPNRKSVRVRQAVIEEKEIQEENQTVEMDESTESIYLPLEMSEDHLETKKKIETLREQFGENWLHCEGGSLVQDLLKLPKIASINSDPYYMDFKRHSSDVLKESSSAAIEQDQSDVVSQESNSEFATASESLTSEDLAESDSDVDVDTEEKEVFTAQVNKENNVLEDVILVITDEYFKERDAVSCKTRSSWPLGVITDCSISETDPATVSMIFDTVRRAMTRREYVLEAKQAQELASSINEIISRSASDKNIVVYKCVQCLLVFSAKVPPTKALSETNRVTCPSCPSTLVFEVNQSELPSNSISNKTIRPDSPIGSIGSAASLQESTVSKSSSNVDENVAKEANAYDTESDIEILSNPSQSSLEALEENLRPYRKKSSEERKVVAVPTLETIPDAVVTEVSGVVMTESSSSGSLTDSVCTTYDARALNAKNLKNESETKTSNPLSTLLEGIFHGAKTGTALPDEQSRIKKVQFSYTDFAQVDHRVKLHIYMNFFDEKDEELVWLLKTSVLRSKTNGMFEGCVLLSTCKFYILNVLDHAIAEEPDKWIRKSESFTLNQCKMIFLLPYEQGLGFELTKSSNEVVHFLAFTQDIQRTTSFLTFISGIKDSPFEVDPKIHVERPILAIQHMLLACCPTEDFMLEFLAIFSKFQSKIDKAAKLPAGILVITDSDLVVIKGDLTFLLPNSSSSRPLEPLALQPISNLAKVEYGGCQLNLHFLDEVNQVEELWTFWWETFESLTTVLTAVQHPWEKIFSVPLIINKLKKVDSN